MSPPLAWILLLSFWTPPAFLILMESTRNAREHLTGLQQGQPFQNSKFRMVSRNSHSPNLSACLLPDVEFPVPGHLCCVITILFYHLCEPLLFGC